MGPVRIAAWRARQSFSEKCVPPHTRYSQPVNWLADKYVAPQTRHTLLEKYLPPQVLYIRTANHVITNISCAVAQEISRPRLVVRRARLTTLRLGPVSKNSAQALFFVWSAQ